MAKLLKASAKSPANIAFIKYWGKADPKTRVPQNNSISMCLSNLYSLCTAEFSDKFKKDEIKFIDEKTVLPKELGRIAKVLDRVRELAAVNLRARVVTQNNFPKATGIASSASGLSAVTLAACRALGLKIKGKELSKLARLASGTASRSIPDGFVEWKKGTDESNSYSMQIFPPHHWAIGDVLAIVTYEMKKTSSTEGHKLADTSPFQKTRIAGMKTKIKAIKQAMKIKDFTAFGQILEQDSLEMHAICLTSTPSILYWSPVTMAIMRQIQEWRSQKKLESYFTIDAGPTVHIICQQKDEKKLAAKLKNIKGIERIVINHPGMGTRQINKHLF
jgi:diphosphomevalonate decarboxylase